MLVVHRIADSFKKLHEPVATAHVLRRSPPFAVDERRVVYVRLAVGDTFDDNFVAPVIAEVVGVNESLDAARNQGSQPQSRRAIELETPELVLLAGYTVVAIPDGELEQMRIGPTEGNLDDVMQGEQVRGERDIDAAPYPRLNILQLDVDACDGLDHGQVL